MMQLQWKFIRKQPKQQKVGQASPAALNSDSDGLEGFIEDHGASNEENCAAKKSTCGIGNDDIDEQDEAVPETVRGNQRQPGPASMHDCEDNVNDDKENDTAAAIDFGGDADSPGSFDWDDDSVAETSVKQEEEFSEGEDRSSEPWEKCTRQSFAPFVVTSGAPDVQPAAAASGHDKAVHLSENIGQDKRVGNAKAAPMAEVMGVNKPAALQFVGSEGRDEDDEGLSISKPCANDVLLDGGAPGHRGNMRFRSLVTLRARAYLCAALKQRKMRPFTRSVVEEVEGWDPPGRFLVEGEVGGTWFPLSKEALLTKIVAARRDACVSAADGKPTTSPCIGGNNRRWQCQRSPRVDDVVRLATTVMQTGWKGAEKTRASLSTNHAPATSSSRACLAAGDTSEACVSRTSSRATRGLTTRLPFARNGPSPYRW
ncbi:hypothetical protein ACHAWF_004956 [Thalassiosira exigua]